MFHPYKIWSLWVLMETFDAGKLFISIVGLSNLGHTVDKGMALAIPINNYQDIKDKIKFICMELERISLPTSLVSARILYDIIYDEVEEQDSEQTPWGKLVVFPAMAFARYRTHASALVNRFHDEMSAKKVMFLPTHKVGYFNGTLNIFPTTVRDNFPSAEYDMDESCKCFALGRYTACVFHLMRIMEAGLNALGVSLGLSVAVNWNTALNEIEKEIRSRTVATHGAAWKNEEPFYAEAATHFRMVKNAWRNHTMHLKEHYDEERAKAVLNNVSDFMRHLATKLSE
jgi:hypothetical protein